MMPDPVEAHRARARAAAALSMRAGATVLILVAIVDAYLGVEGRPWPANPAGAVVVGAWIGLAGVGITSAISFGATVFALYTHLIGPRHAGTTT